MAWFAAAAPWISAALGAAGSMQSGQAGAAQLEYEAKVAGMNAGLARQNAATARLAGQAAEEAKRREIRREMGKSAAAISEAGIGGPSTGTAAMLLEQSGAEAELDALNIRYGAQSEARAHEIDAVSSDYARMAALAGVPGVKAAGLMGAGAAALGGYADYSGRKAQFPTRSSRGYVPPPKSYNIPGLVGY